MDNGNGFLNKRQKTCNFLISLVARLHVPFYHFSCVTKLSSFYINLVWSTYLYGNGNKARLNMRVLLYWCFVVHEDVFDVDNEKNAIRDGGSAAL